MNDPNAFDRFVADRFAREPGGPAPTDDTIHDLLTKASHVRQRPRWLAILKEPPMRHASRVAVGSPIARVTALAAATLIMALLVTGALVAGAQSPSPAPPRVTAAPQPPVAYTGTWCIGPPVAPDRAGTDEPRLDVGDEGMTLARYRGGAWSNAVVMSDPRLQGDAYQTYETDTYAPAGSHVIASTLSIVNDAGAWVSRLYRASADATDPADSTYSIFIGEGAYDGLIAMMENTDPVPRPEEVPIGYSPCNEVRGIIFDGAPLAEPYLPE